MTGDDLRHDRGASHSGGRRPGGRPWSRGYRGLRPNVMLGTVRHATQEDLDQVEPLLVELRKLPQLRERKRGSFSRGSRPFLHFHEDGGELYVDVRLDGAFRRAKVTSGKDQADLLARVRGEPLE